ncbi:peptidoglycan-binding protein [Mangrovicoccus sp. HB161399]|uniref:peptidoglycan-binding protein n=1 Tax=Mangrovicoccus sp. HB161399 TaxID=2720392 RepID=UPI001554F622|nr:peptidoglycan-binding protein [Mangrovicoccus sp. HB161399]
MIPVDGDFILEVAPNFSGRFAQRQKEIVGAISGDFESVLRDYAIDTPLRIAHFMGQVTHECAGFRTTEEFASGAAYEGRKDLGNSEKGDGRRYKGRGLIQLTGRANYRQMGERLGLPLEDEPHVAARPVTSLRIACEYWKSRDINARCDADDLIAVTELVNGGRRGLQDRAGYLRKAKTALAKRQAIMVAARQGGTDPVLRRGSFGSPVIELQQLLIAQGAAITIDAEFGPATETALKAFQRTAGLDTDGIAGALTWAALRG